MENCVINYMRSNLMPPGAPFDVYIHDECRELVESNPRLQYVCAEGTWKIYKSIYLKNIRVIVFSHPKYPTEKDFET